MSFFCHPSPKTTGNQDDTADSDENDVQEISSNEYEPPRVWTCDEENGDSPSATRTTAGPRYERELPVGTHPLQLYSMGTPNGQKVTILLEELLAAGVKDAEYDAWMINIMNGDQFSSGFVEVNPNSKIPALMDYSQVFKQEQNNRRSASTSALKPIRISESNSILLYLAEKFQSHHSFLPKQGDLSKQQLRVDILNWMWWQCGAAPAIGSGFGHFFVLAKGPKQQYPIDRFTTEVKRQLDVLNRQLEKQHYVCGNNYTLADISIFSWYGALVLDGVYNPRCKTFLNVENDYPHVLRWAKRVKARPAVQRGMCVNKFWGSLSPRLKERHSAEDIDRAFSEFTWAQKSEVSLSKLDKLTSEAYTDTSPPTQWSDAVLLVPHEWLRQEMAAMEVSVEALPDKLGWDDTWKAVYFCRWIVDYFVKVVQLHHDNEEKIYLPFLLDYGAKFSEEEMAEKHKALNADLAAIEELAAAVVKDDGWWSQGRIRELKVKIPSLIKDLKTHFTEEERLIPKAIREAGISKEQSDQYLQQMAEAGGTVFLQLELPGILESTKVWASNAFVQEFTKSKIPPPVLALAEEIFIPNLKNVFHAQRDAPTMSNKPELKEVPFDPSMLPPRE